MHGYHGSKQRGAAGSGGVTFCERFSQLARRLLAFPPSTSTLCFVTTERSGERRKSSWRPTRGDAAGEGCRLTGAAAGRQWGVDANVKKKRKPAPGTALDKWPFLFRKHEVKSCRPTAAAARWPWSCASSRGHAPPLKRLSWGQRVSSFIASVWRAVNQPTPLIC